MHNYIIKHLTLDEYRDGGKALTIYVSFKSTRFGNILIAATDKGVCNIMFYDHSTDNALNDLAKYWPNATVVTKEMPIHMVVERVFATKNTEESVSLHLKGTPFQMKVWSALLTIPYGTRTSYGTIATVVGNSHAQRAVGTAIGNNPIAYLIPCHRVVRANGEMGNYRWGEERKQAMVDWEQGCVQ